MTFFANLLEALQNSQRLKADRLIRRYSYLVVQARVYEEKEKIEKVKKLASAAASQPSFIGELPLRSQ